MSREFKDKDAIFFCIAILIVCLIELVMCLVDNFIFPMPNKYYLLPPLAVAFYYVIGALILGIKEYRAIQNEPEMYEDTLFNDDNK